MNTTRFALLATAVLTLCTGLQAQSSGPIRTSTESLPDGHVLVHVENLSIHTITAVAVVGKRVLNAGLTDTSVRFFDSVLSPQRGKPIVLGKTADFNLFGPRPSPEQTTRSVEVKAVLFDDGGSWGDPEWISRLVNRRMYVHAQVVSVLSEIAGMAAANASREYATQRFREDRDRMVQNGRDVDEKQMANIVLTNALLTLSGARRPDGSAIATQDSLSEAKSWLTVLRDRVERSKPQIAH